MLPGHLLSWRPNSQAKLRRYWEVRRQEHADDLQSTVQRTRELVTRALGSQLHADVPVCSLLSGGLDSTALTGIAQRIAKAEHGGDINSFSVDFVGQAEQFRSDDLRPDQDQPFALLAAQYIGSRHRTVLIDNAELVCERAREEVFRAKDVPFTFGDMDTSLHLMFGEIRRHSTVAISGEGADELFGGYGWFRDPQAVAAARFPGPPGCACQPASSTPVSTAAAISSSTSRPATTMGCARSNTWPATARRSGGCASSATCI